MRKIPVPKRLNAVKKRDGVLASQTIFADFGAILWDF
jgi:hypothetical protein